MIASLPMYDRPENALAHDALWALIRDGLRARGIAAPQLLDRETDYMAGWARPELVLGQICNLPYRAAFRGRVTRIGCADYGLPDTEPGHYHSVLIVRQDDPAGALEDCEFHRLAYSDGLSQSGFGALYRAAAARGLRLRPHLRTGAHLASLWAVIEGQADMATLDAVSFRNLAAFVPETAAVKVIDRLPGGPGMTFITAGQVDPTPYRAAIVAAIAALPAAPRDLLGLRGFAVLPESDYDLPLPPDPATLTF
jgi:ABC-type phosphate/phosphonate transport system substrate-binding protein